MSSQKVLFIVWANNSRRAETIAAHFGGKASLQFNAKLKKKKWLAPLRYAQAAWGSWQALEKEKPQAVLVQTPPVFAGMLVWAWCKLRKRKYAVDAHSGSFYYSRWKWALPLQRWISRRAAICLVAHEDARQIVQSWGAEAIFLEDKIPSLPPTPGELGSVGNKRIAIVSSFDYDEPEEELFEAARRLPDVQFYHTGNWRKASAALLEKKPENLTLTGFVSDEEYRALLHNVQGVIVLTTEPNLLNCGAYEALAVEKPGIISDWPGLRSYFRRGFVYVKNTPQDIADGVQKLFTEQDGLIAEGKTLLTELSSDWERKAAQVASKLSL